MKLIQFRFVSYMIPNIAFAGVTTYFTEAKNSSNI